MKGLRFSLSVAVLVSLLYSLTPSLVFSQELPPPIHRVQ